MNADKLLNQLENAGYLDLREYKLTGVLQENWTEALEKVGELQTRIEKAGNVPHVRLKEDMLICENNDLDAYTAALITDFLRYRMLDEQISFSFETVMSHPGKIDFLEFANPEYSPRNLVVHKASRQWRRRRTEVR
ncbi:hypothetical protein [Halalkalibaculum sp. DA384]|uniref:hypothetical protein n=1 Tax=Halalkalibaculum sp. DA384 TaxID=3373606 RepID=UPI003753F72A